MVNTIMDHVCAPAHAWFLCLQYVTSLLNFTYSNWIKCTPIFALTGSTNDISMLLYFHFWQPVYFCNGEKPVFPSESHESHGHFVVFAEHVGHAMTFKVLSDESQKVLWLPLQNLLCPHTWEAESESQSYWWGDTLFC